MTVTDADAPPTTPVSGQSWLVLNYRFPKEPSRTRVRTWRAIQQLGGIQLQSGVVALPDAPSTRAAFSRILDEITANEGTSCQLLRTELISGTLDLALIYNAAREKEYARLVVECDEFRRGLREHKNRPMHVQWQRRRSNLTRLRRAYTAICDRDLLGAPGRIDALKAVQRCKDALDLVERATGREV